MITLRTRRRPTDESPVLSDEERQRAEHWLRDD